jgi:YggT family protein
MDSVINYVEALFWVFTIIILVRILLSWLPSPPVSGPLRAAYDFIHQSTDWYLSIFRRVIPPIGMFDLSPMVALIVLFILRGVVVSVLSGI